MNTSRIFTIIIILVLTELVHSSHDNKNEMVIRASSVNFVTSKSYPYDTVQSEITHSYDASLGDKYSDEEVYIGTEINEENGEGLISTSEIFIETEESNRVNNVNRAESIPHLYSGRYGGYYRNYNELKNEIVQLDKPVSAYIHGRFQEVKPDYYKHYSHTSADKSALGYYLGAALKYLYKRQQIKVNYTINHYYHQENPYKPQRYTSDRQLEYIPPEVIIECRFDAITLCPENTEPLCLRNKTIVCMSIMSAVRPCDSYPEMSCVDTMVPCTDSTKLCVDHLETVSMPCLMKLIIETPKGGTLIWVAKTFVMAPETPEEERSYCAMIIAEPILGEE